MRPLALPLLLLASPASAHFLQLLPSADFLPEGGTVTLSLAFTHPFEQGPVMDLSPAQVSVVQNGQSRALSGALQQTGSPDARQWQLTDRLAEPGVALYSVSQAPYWEPAEGKYIRHHAKVVVDSYGAGEGWEVPLGMPAEIVPLTQPNALWVGNLFSGVVLAAGKPVPHATVEVEFVNTTGLKAPSPAYVTQVIHADATGTFHYAMPFAGWWGFAALLEGEPMPAPEGEMVPAREGDLVPAREGEMVPVEEGGLLWVNPKAPL